MFLEQENPEPDTWCHEAHYVINMGKADKAGL